MLSFCFLNFRSIAYLLTIIKIIRLFLWYFTVKLFEKELQDFTIQRLSWFHIPCNIPVYSALYCWVTVVHKTSWYKISLKTF